MIRELFDEICYRWTIWIGTVLLILNPKLRIQDWIFML